MKDRWLQVRVDEQEHKALERLSQQAGVTMSEMVRRSILQASAAEPPKKAEKR